MTLKASSWRLETAQPGTKRLRKASNFAHEAVPDACTASRKSLEVGVPTSNLPRSKETFRKGTELQNLAKCLSFLRMISSAAMTSSKGTCGAAELHQS